MIDLNLLAESNELSQKWADKAKISKCRFMKFITGVCADPMAFAATLSPSKRKEFIADLDKMFYASKHEQELVLKFKPAIYHLLKRFKIKDTNCFPDLISLGFQTVRTAIWRYRMPHIKLTTYVFNGIICAYRGELSRLKEAKAKTKVIVHSRMRSSITENTTIDKKSPEPYEIAVGNQLADFLKSKKFTSEEREILTFFMGRDCHVGFNWCTVYRNYRTAQKRKTPHRSELRKKIVVIKRKIAKHLLSVDAERYQELYNSVMELKL